MTEDERLLARCRVEIEQKTGWGPARDWTNQDFTELSTRIATATDIHLSPTTLKRVWGRVAYASSPSATTLDALAAYAGYDNWRAFRSQRLTASAPPIRKAKNPARLYLYYLLPLAAVAALIVLLSPAPAAAPYEVNPDDYAFNFRPVTTGIPNSVVFQYDASAAPFDSVYLQQSWDEQRRERIPRAGNVHTSIYYLPGFFNAKLVVGNQVVKTRDLYLHSEGWVTAVATESVPVYFPPDSVIRKGRIQLTAPQLTSLGLSLQPQPPQTVYTNVGSPEGLFSDDFSFRTRLRHDYGTGAAACQQARILLLLKNSAIIIPLSRPGCVADLYLLANGRSFTGAEHDLSAFGVVGDTWLEVGCTGQDGLLTFTINGQPVFQVEGDEEPKEFVGIRYEFSGLGSVDELTFANSSGTIWSESFNQQPVTSNQ
ncbi:MAG: hypothetical protein AAFZ52_00795 [Bacteroidota bacterium]